MVPGWNGGYVFAQYQHFWFQDADVPRPTSAPFSNFNFENEMDMFRVGAAFPFNAGFLASDSRLKRDIERVARLDNGLGLYRYRYLWSDTEYVGVMAQEVAETRPEAVRRGADGFLRVDYSQLGTRLMTWQEWSLPQALASTLVVEGAE